MIINSAIKSKSFLILSKYPLPGLLCGFQKYFSGMILHVVPTVPSVRDRPTWTFLLYFKGFFFRDVTRVIWRICLFIFVLSQRFFLHKFNKLRSNVIQKTVIFSHPCENITPTKWSGEQQKQERVITRFILLLYFYTYCYVLPPPPPPPLLLLLLL
jgi:hypothetical protein